MTISSPSAGNAAKSIDLVHRAMAYSYVRFSIKRQSNGDVAKSSSSSKSRACWPKGHAAIQLHNDDTKIIVQLAATAQLQIILERTACPLPGV